VWAAKRPRLLLRELTLGEPAAGGKKLDFTWPGGQPRPTEIANLELPRPWAVDAGGGTAVAKSTLLRLIAGLLEPVHGPHPLPRQRRLVFQNPESRNALLPKLCHPTCSLSLPTGLDQHRTADAAFGRRPWPRVGLAGFEQRPIQHLSGRPRSSVLAIAGALASEARLLLMDEPTALLRPHQPAGGAES